MAVGSKRQVLRWSWLASKLCSSGDHSTTLQALCFMHADLSPDLSYSVSILVGRYACLCNMSGPTYLSVSASGVAIHRDTCSNAASSSHRHSDMPTRLYQSLSSSVKHLPFRIGSHRSGNPEEFSAKASPHFRSMHPARTRLVFRYRGSYPIMPSVIPEYAQSMSLRLARQYLGRNTSVIRKSI